MRIIIDQQVIGDTYHRRYRVGKYSLVCKRPYVIESDKLYEDDNPKWDFRVVFDIEDNWHSIDKPYKKTRFANIENMTMELKVAQETVKAE
jgi:hypothetical protein